MGNKYRNIKCKCLLGHKHDSKLESAHCNRLFALQQAGKITSFIVHPIYDLVVCGSIVCKHIPDFYINKNDGHAVIHDTKGIITSVASIKRKLFMALYPGLSYKIIKKGVPTMEEMGL